MSQPAGQDSSPHQQGRVVLVTGATSGIGFHTARQLAARGASVLITGRDRKQGEDAARAVASAGHARVEFIQADHATVGANNQLGQAVTERLGKLGLPPRLDVLVNNVGGIFATRTLTADGYEATLAVNFLAPVVLTHSLLPLLQASGSPRCVNVTSSLAWLARQVPGDLLADIQSTRDYVGIRAHARAKLLTAAWTLAIGHQQAGTGLVAATVNPGMAWTTMTQALTPQVVPSWRYVYPLVRFFQKRGDPAKAARVCVELAWTASPAAISGQYITEHGKPGRYPPGVADPAVQDQVVSTAGDLARHAPTAAGHKGRP